MCKVGGPRCPSSKSGISPEQRQRRKQNRQFRRELAAEVEAQGHPDIARQVRSASMSSLPGIVEALGVNPDKFSAPMPGQGPSRHRIPEKDAAIAAALVAAKKPTTGGTEVATGGVRERIVSQTPPGVSLRVAELAQREGSDENGHPYRIGTRDELLSFVNDPKTQEAATNARNRWHLIDDERQALNDEIRSIEAQYKKSGISAGGQYLFDMKRKAQDLTLEALEARDDYEHEADKLADEIEARTLNGYTLPQFDPKEGLGEATVKGSYDELSPEWHAARKDGIGGSSVLAAAGLEEGYGGKVKKMSAAGSGYARKALIEDKLADPEVAASESETSHSGAAHRGHVWEPVMIADYQNFLDSDPETEGLIATVGKETWQGKDEWGVVNVDGIVTNPDGTPHHLVECKDVTSRTAWANGVPLKYRAQSLYYLDQTGLPYMDLLARENGEITRHRIYKGETIDGTDKGATVEDIRPDLEAAWSEVKDAKRKRAEDPQWAPKAPPARKPIGNSNYDRGQAVDNLYGLMHYRYHSRAAAKEEFDSYMAANDKNVDAAVRAMLNDHYDPSKQGRIVSVDLETATAVKNESGDDPRAFHPRYSSIIQVGATVVDGDEEVGSYNSYHAPHPRIMKRNGTGAVDVHNITPEMVEDKPQLSDPEANKEVRRVLTSGSAVLAHNVAFEKKMLKEHLVDDVDRPWIDTAWISRHFMEPGEDGSRGATLRDTIEDLGGEYPEDSHRGDVDARTGAQAYSLLQQAQWWKNNPHAVESAAG